MAAVSPFQRALEGWRKTRSPRYAALVDALATDAPTRPLVGAGKRKADVAAWDALELLGELDDTPRLLATLGTAMSPIAALRVPRLAQRDDPRVVPGLFALLEKPPYTGGQSKKFWQAVIAALAASRDPRARDGMRALSRRYQPINGTFMGDWIASAMARAADKMTVAGALSAADLQALEALEVAVLGAVPAAAPAATTRTLDELFAQIVAAPDDDGARLVYADALIERASSELDRLRGEVIVLQVARAAGTGTLAQADRERSLRGDDFDALAIPLSAACDTVTFERGFPVSALLKAKGLAQVADAVEWGTVRRLSGIDAAPLKPLLALFASGRLRNVTDVGDLSAARLAKLAPYAARWTRVELAGDPLPDDALRALPALRTLVVHGYQPAPAAWLAGAPQLVDLEVWNDELAITAGVLAALPALRRLSLRRASSSLRSGMPALPIEALCLSAPIVEAAAWLAALPAVRALTVHDGELLRRDGVFDWPALGTLLASSLTSLTLERSRGSLTARFERDAQGWTLVWPCADRWVGFYEELIELAPHLARRVTRVILEPKAPRHYAEPFCDIRHTSLDQIRAAWAPLPVELREVTRWPGDAPGERYAEANTGVVPVR